MFSDVAKDAGSILYFKCQPNASIDSNRPSVLAGMVRCRGARRVRLVEGRSGRFRQITNPALRCPTPFASAARDIQDIQ